MKLSPRLDAVLSWADGHTLADIGTDHAKLPITACLQNRVQEAIACDIHQKPLDRAIANIKAFSLEHRIETRLGDGLLPIKPHETDVIVISGMGGMKMMEIINNAPETARSAKKIIFQPQHDIPALRKTLHSNKFAITDEDIIKEGKRFYILLSAAPVDEINLWTATEYRWGKILMAKKSPVWQEYMTWEGEKIQRYINNPGTDKDTLSQLLEEVKTFGS
jgi:tRNA (adenine22-N1)-methyltransferase